MILNTDELLKQIINLGYFSDDYCIDLDEKLAYQEYLLVTFVRDAGMKSFDFDPDEVFVTKASSVYKEALLNIWNNYYLASKTQFAVILKPWDKVLTDKRNIKIDRKLREKYFPMNYK